jgi:hypothetical protein
MPRKPVARSPHGRMLPQASQQKNKPPAGAKNIGPCHDFSIGVCRSHEQVFLRHPLPSGRRVDLRVGRPAGREVQIVGGQHMGCPPTDQTLTTARLPLPQW